MIPARDKLLSDEGIHLVEVHDYTVVVERARERHLELVMVSMKTFASSRVPLETMGCLEGEQSGYPGTHAPQLRWPRVSPVYSARGARGPSYQFSIE